MKVIFYAASVLAVSGLSAHASPIFDSVVTGGTPTTVGTTTVAESFTTGATSGAVNDIALALTKGSASSSGSVVITLWSDNGQGLSNPTADAPGTQIMSIGTVAASSLSLGVRTIEFYSPTTSLSANTEYWIEVAKTGATTSSIQYYLNSAAPTIGGTVGALAEVYRSGSVSSAVPPDIELCVSGDGSCAATLAAAAAPEPSTMSILGFGIAAIGFGVHRRRWARPSGSSAD